MGAVILLLLIIVVLCAVVLCMYRTRDASTTAPSNDDTVNYGLYTTIKPIELDMITTNNNVPTEPEHIYVQPKQFIQPSDLEDGIKMKANPVSMGEDGVTTSKIPTIAINQRYNATFFYLSHPLSPTVLNQLVMVKMVSVINHKVMIIINKVIHYRTEVYAYTICMDTY